VDVAGSQIPCDSRSPRSSSGADVILIVILQTVIRAEADILMTATLLIDIPMTVIPILHAAAVTTTSA
jgi:hypothetical protein